MELRASTKWAVYAVWTFGLLLLTATLIPLVSTNLWWVRVFSFPQIQITILLVLCLVAAAVLLNLSRTGPRLLLIGLIAALVYQAIHLVPYTPLHSKEVETAEACRPDQRVRLLVFNVLKDNRSHEQVRDLIRRAAPDLFLAVETDFVWTKALQPLKASYPNVVSAPRGGAWGMMLFSKLPLVQPEVRYLVDDYVPSIRSEVRLTSGSSFLFYGLHPKPPAMHSTARGDAELIEAGREIRQQDSASILAGDLNDVPWSDTTQLFQEVSQMRDTRVGRSFLPTFKATNPILRWPLDHVFVTPAFRLLALERLPNAGSDHFPLLAILCHLEETSLAPPAGPTVTKATNVIEAGTEAGGQ